MGCDLCASVSLVCKVGGVHGSWWSCRDAHSVTAERLERHQRGGCPSSSGRVVAPWQPVCLLTARPLSVTDLSSCSPGTSIMPTTSLRSSSSSRRKGATAHRYGRGASGRLMTDTEVPALGCGGCGFGPDCRPDAHGVLSNFSTSELNETCRAVEISPTFIVR